MTDESKVNKHDPEDCEACGEAEAECLYHEGLSAGWAGAMKLLQRIAADPDYAAEHYMQKDYA